MKTDRELLKRAFECIRSCIPMVMAEKGWKKREELLDEIADRLAQSEQEPVAWADPRDLNRPGHDLWVSNDCVDHYTQPLYTAPPLRDLTDEEIEKIAHEAQKYDETNEPWFDRNQFARAIIAAMKGEK